MTNILQEDLDHVLAHTEGVWEEFRGQRIFITGGTGFFGCWLLESFIWANDKLGLGASATVLTRNPEAFTKKAPHLAGHPAVKLQVGDVRTFEFPEEPFSHVIHAATEASAKLNAENPLLMFDTIVEGTRRVLDFAVRAGAKKFLLTSSGAVYGRQPSDMTHIPESYQGAPDPLASSSGYGEGKRAAEMLCTLYEKQYGIEMKIARCFAFVGPYLPLDAHYAVGNFIRDALQGRAIIVKGDGSPYRSYLYAADLVIWLWTLLSRGRGGIAYNVGSGRDMTIADVAALVAGNAKQGRVEILGDITAKPYQERYVPNVGRAESDLGLIVRVELDEAIRRTLKYQSQCLK